MSSSIIRKEPHPVHGRMRFLPSFLLLLSLFLQDDIYAQGCCTAGASSLSGFESTVQPYKTLTLAANYQFNSLTQAYQGSENIDDPLMRTAEVSYFTLQAEYGLQPHVSFLVSLYYSDKSRELTIQSGQGNSAFTETARFRGSGLGDLTLLAKYRIAGASITSRFGLTLGGGATLPVGSYTKEQDGSRLSIDLQPGTGGVALIAWGHAGYSLPESGYLFFLTGMYRYSTGNLDGYRVGDEIITNLGGEKRLGESFAVSLVLRSRYGMKDYADTRFLSGTGGTYHDLMPGVTYTDGPSAVKLIGQIPLYRNVRGIQLTSSYLLGVEYGYTFDFRGVVDLIMPEL